MKLFILRKIANLGLGFLLEHRDFFIQTSTTVLKWWKGKKLAIIGPESSGKDSLWNRLRGLSPHESATFMDRKIPEFKIDFNLSDGRRINLTCKRSLNIGGEENYRDEEQGWKQVCQDSDVIFYIMTIDDLLSKKYLNGRIQKDLEWFHRTLPYLKKNSLIHILINKVDTKIKDYTEYDEFKSNIKQDILDFDEFVRRILSPWDKTYTGLTLISASDEHIYLKGIERVFNKIYKAIHPEK
ncbi:MAG: hypothetical protein WDA09_04570 [Bacteriovoracaceae bacterium]